MMRALATALAGALSAAAALPLAAQTLQFDCSGSVRVEDVFDGGGVSGGERQWQILANFEGGYVRRAPELASGCLEPTVEVCGCELASAAIRCRSLGISPQGVEVGMDFSIDRSNGRMNVSGRRFDPRSGTVIETSGQLACTESEIRQ